jgi:hypothetical protein
MQKQVVSANRTDGRTLRRTQPAVSDSSEGKLDAERRAAQFAARNQRGPYKMWLEALERAHDALKRGELKLVEREIEYVREKLERVA